VLLLTWQLSLLVIFRYMLFSRFSAPPAWGGGHGSSWCRRAPFSGPLEGGGTYLEAVLAGLYHWDSGLLARGEMLGDVYFVVLGGICTA
jgi:hypothetical protein